MNLSEEKVISDLKKGNENALEHLYNEHYISLCTYAIDLVGDTEAGSDIVSEFFCFLWEHRKQINIKESLKSYLFKSIRNRCLNHLNHQRIIQKYKTQSESLGAQVDEINLEFLKMNRHVEKMDITKRIETAIENLPEQARIVFKLKRQEGRTYEQISKELNISVNTIRTQMSRALDKLRKALADLKKNNDE